MANVNSQDSKIREERCVIIRAGISKRVNLRNRSFGLIEGKG